MSTSEELSSQKQNYNIINTCLAYYFYVNYFSIIHDINHATHLLLIHATLYVQ